MRRHLAAVSFMLVAIPSAWAATPNILGTWTPVEPFVMSGSGESNAGWNATPGPSSKPAPDPHIVFDKQDGRVVSGYMAAPGGERTPIHGMIKSDGSSLTARNSNGVISADIKGNQMEWCFTSMKPNIDYVACNPFQRQAAK